MDLMYWWDTGWRIGNTVLALTAIAVVSWRIGRAWSHLPVRMRYFGIALVMFIIVAVIGSIETTIKGISPGYRTAALSVALGWSLVGGLSRSQRKKDRGDQP